MKFVKGLLSVVIPVYNIGVYLGKCIESVLNQTYFHLEIIIVDDGSTDGSSQICDRYQKQDDRIVVYHVKHGGASRARNVGLRCAKGEFIGFVDGDDFIDSDMYEKMLSEMKDSVDIVTCGRYISFPSERHLKGQLSYLSTRPIKVDGVTAIEELLECKVFSFSVCDKVFRRDLFEDIMFPLGRTCEDIPVTYKLFTKSRNVVNIAKAKYHNFHRADSSSRQEFYYRRVDQALFAGELCRDIRNDCPRLIMQAEALYIEYVAYTINCIRCCKNRLRYRDVEKRLKRVLRRMYIRVLFNPYITGEKKKSYFLLHEGS